MKTFFSSDRLGVGGASLAQVRLEDVVEAAIWHAVLVETIRGLGDLLAQNNITVGCLELDGVVGLSDGLVTRLWVDDLVLDVATDIAQRRVLEGTPESVDELVGELRTSTGRRRQGSKDANEKLSGTSKDYK